MSALETRDVRWGKLPLGHTVMVPVDAHDLQVTGRLFVVPAASDEPRSFMAAATPMSGADESYAPPDLRCLFVVIATNKLTTCHRKRHEGVHYRVWIEDEVERFPSPVSLATAILQKENLPLTDGARTHPIMTDPEFSEDEDEPAANAKRDRADREAHEKQELAAMISAAVTASMAPMARRLDQLELDARAPRGGSMGVLGYGDDGGDSEAGVREAAKARRPGDDPTRAATGGVSVVRTAAASAVKTAALSGGGTGEQLSRGAIVEAVTLAVLAATAAAKPEKLTDPLTDPFSGGFKLKGAEGRVRQGMLDKELEERPEVVSKCFESLVARRMGKTTFKEVALSDFAKRHIPMGSNKTATRYLEAMVSIYTDLDEGRTAHAKARLALVIGATHQHVLDDGDWDPAWWITGLPRPAQHEYATKPRKEKGQFSSEDDAFACSVDPRRAQTARQIRTDAKAALQ